MTNDSNSNTFMLSNKWYDVAKKMVQVVMPATASLYFGLSAIWDVPAPEQVVGTIALFTTFFGVVLGISTKQYQNSDAPYDGQLEITRDESGDEIFSLALDGDPFELASQKAVAFKVQSPDAN